MKEFFANLYEWFGLVHLYSRDMSDFLKGWDYACVGYFALPCYLYSGLIMILLTTLLFALQYDLISVARFPDREHWELAVVVVVICNFLLALPFRSLPFRWRCTALGCRCHCLTASPLSCLSLSGA